MFVLGQHASGFLRLLTKCGRGLVSLIGLHGSGFLRLVKPIKCCSVMGLELARKGQPEKELPLVTTCRQISKCVAVGDEGHRRVARPRWSANYIELVSSIVKHRIAFESTPPLV